MADADRLVAALQYLDEQKSANPLEGFSLGDAYRRKVQPIINNAMQTFQTGGIVGDILRAYGSAAAPVNAAVLEGMGMPSKAPLSDPAGPVATSGENFRPMGDTTAQMAGAIMGDPTNLIPLAGPAARGAVAAGKYAGPELARGLEAHMARTGMLQPLDVWHGTPHRFAPTERNPLGEFDATKIGTGEGAQVKGYGHYLAEQPLVAKQYKDQLSPRNIKGDSSQVGNWADWAAKGSDDSSHAMKMIDDLILQSKKEKPPTGFDNWDEFSNKVKLETRSRFGGNLYKADLPDEAIPKMLDWDRPMSQQTEAVQQAINKQFSIVKDLNSDGPWVTLLAGRPINSFATKKAANEWLQNAKGAELYDSLSPTSGTPGASNYLKSLGIPGIKYLDQGSRAGGEGTRNFVVFPGNERLLNILERNGEKAVKPFAYPQDEALRLAQQRAALPVEQGGLGLPADNTAIDRAKAMGAVDYLHGTERLDRVLAGKTLNPKKATSGPMPFGTNNPTIASNYAMGKADSSLALENTGNLADYFQVFPKAMGQRGTLPRNVEQIWHLLPSAKKTEILDKAQRIGYANPEQGSGGFTLHPTGEGKPFSQSHWDYTLNRESKGNPLTALRKIYAESGMLDPYAPSELADIYKMAGFPYEISQANAPWTSAKGVLAGKAIISNPLNTSDINTIQDKVIPFLKNQLKNDRTKTKPYGADQWDKNVRYTPKEWVNQLEEDFVNGINSNVWTSIPDKISNQLEKLGFNGIIDTGGKMGGEGHQVVIPFHPEQVRSRFAAFDPFRRNAAIATAMGVAAPDLLANETNPNNLVQALKYLESTK